MKILCIAGAISVYNGGLASFNIAIGKYKQHTLRTFAGSCVLILSSLFLVRYGLLYVCILFLLVNVLWTFLSIDLARRHLTLTLKKISHSCISIYGGKFLYVSHCVAFIFLSFF